MNPASTARIGADIVGECVESPQAAAVGDVRQRTTTGEGFWNDAERRAAFRDVRVGVCEQQQLALPPRPLLVTNLDIAALRNGKAEMGPDDAVDGPDVGRDVRAWIERREHDVVALEARQ